jgi:voltage-gated potassium channel
VRRIASGIIEMRWPTVFCITLLHAFITWLGLTLMGETDLVSGVVQFIYYFVVTASSVGYGDFSPTTDIGKLFCAIWVIPGAIGLFAFLVGKAAASLTSRIRKNMNGQGNFENIKDHVVVLGYVTGQTGRLLKETRRLQGSRDVVIVSTEDLSTLRDKWDWVRAASLSSTEDLRRANIENAEFIVIMGRDDNESLTACLAVNAMTKKGSCVAYFRDREPAALVKASCPKIEVVTSTSVEQVARAISDPGAGQVLHHLASTSIGATLGSMTFQGRDTVTVKYLTNEMRARFPIMELADNTEILKGEAVYYVAGQRIPEGTVFRGDDWTAEPDDLEEQCRGRSFD